MATVVITAPAQGFTGTRAGVTFRDGRGEVDADNAGALAYFARHGYAIDAGPTPPKKEPRARTAAARPDDAAANPSAEGDPSDA